MTWLMSVNGSIPIHICVVEQMYTTPYFYMKVWKPFAFYADLVEEMYAIPYFHMNVWKPFAFHVSLLKVIVFVMHMYSMTLLL